MSNSLSVRDQNRFISAYKNLLNDSDKRIHKDDINTLKKILNKCDKVEVGQLIMTKMESYPKNPAALENTFSKCFDKLEAQDSKINDKKEKGLKNIQQKLTPIVQDIENNRKNAQNKKINAEIKTIDNEIKLIDRNVIYTKDDITKLENDIANADVQIKKNHDEIKPMADELNSTSPEEFSAKDAQRLKNTEEKISQIAAKENQEINALNKKIATHENSRAALIDFARRRGVVKSVELDLIKAERGDIYDNRDMGFGTTSWREHMGSDKYAIKHFGHDLKEGRRQYSDQIKVPNHDGKQWQKLMRNFDDAPKNIKALKKEISEIKSEYKSDIDQINFKNRLTAKQEIEQRINSKKEAIRSFEDSKKSSLINIKLSHNYISRLEAQKSRLMEKMEELSSQIKQNS